MIIMMITMMIMVVMMVMRMTMMLLTIIDVEAELMAGKDVRTVVHVFYRNHSH